MMRTMPADAVSGGDRGGSDLPVHPADAVRRDAAGRDGVEERLAAVYRAEVGRLVALGRMLTSDAAAGEDLAHETFLVATRMCRRDPDYLREPAWPWLRTTLTRLAIRRRHRSIGELRRLAHLYERPREDAWSGATIDDPNAQMQASAVASRDGRVLAIYPSSASISPTVALEDSVSGRALGTVGGVQVWGFTGQDSRLVVADTGRTLLVDWQTGARVTSPFLARQHPQMAGYMVHEGAPELLFETPAGVYVVDASGQERQVSSLSTALLVRVG